MSMYSIGGWLLGLQLTNKEAKAMYIVPAASSLDL